MKNIFDFRTTRYTEERIPFGRAVTTAKAVRKAKSQKRGDGGRPLWFPPSSRLGTEQLDGPLALTQFRDFETHDAGWDNCITPECDGALNPLLTRRVVIDRQPMPQAAASHIPTRSVSKGQTIPRSRVES
jgi:hypothetical protein